MSNSERIRPPWWLKYVNKVMIGVQRLGFGFGAESADQHLESTGWTPTIRSSPTHGSPSPVST